MKTHSAISTGFRTIQRTISPRLSKAAHYLRLTFIKGPKILLTSRISLKCAAAMIMMCMPSLLFFSILTIPAMLFQSPQQNAYFHFARILNEDPTRWIVLSLGAVCAVMSLAVPASMPAPRSSSISY